MTEQDNPRPTSSKDFQKEVVNAIIRGDLAAFKKCSVGDDDINQRLLQSEELKPIPKYNLYENLINIRGPTMLMYAILCEQDQIVEYILDCKSPNVNIYVEGYNCLHLAAMMKDHRCLKLLLQHKWIQENIDMPIDLPDTHQREGEGTTALHLAVSNKRYANVFLLIKEMPKARWPQKRSKRRTEEEENDDYMFVSSANVNKKSASGSTPLHIAVSLCDYIMVKILLAANSDILIQDANGKTPLDLALEYQHANNIKKQSLQKSKDDEIDDIVNALQKADCDDEVDTLDYLIQYYAPQLIERKFVSISTSSDDDDEINESNQEKDPELDSENQIGQILDLIQKLKSRVSNLEKKRGVSGEILGQISNQFQELNSKLSCLEEQKGNSRDIIGQIVDLIKELNSKILYLEEPENK